MVSNGGGCTTDWMGLYVLTIHWTGSCLGCKFTDVGIDPLDIFEIFYIFVQRVHTAGNLTGMGQVDKLAVSSGTDLHAGGALEANITQRSTFETYFWWVIWSIGVALVLQPREPDSIEL